MRKIHQAIFLTDGQPITETIVHRCGNHHTIIQEKAENLQPENLGHELLLLNTQGMSKKEVKKLPWESIFRLIQTTSLILFVNGNRAEVENLKILRGKPIFYLDA